MLIGPFDDLGELIHELREGSEEVTFEEFARSLGRTRGEQATRIAELRSGFSGPGKSRERAYRSARRTAERQLAGRRVSPSLTREYGRLSRQRRLREGGFTVHRDAEIWMRISAERAPRRREIHESIYFDPEDAAEILDAATEGAAAGIFGELFVAAYLDVDQIDAEITEIAGVMVEYE